MDDEDNIVVTDDDDEVDDAELDDEDIDKDDDDESLEDEPTLTFKIENGRIRGKIDEQEAMIQAVDKILRTERLVFPIYSDQYGNDLNGLIGKDMGYAKVEVERMLKEALLADERVIDVKLDEVMQTANDTLAVRGICITVFGDIDIDSEVDIDEP